MKTRVSFRIPALLALLSAPWAHAAILTWNGGVSGDWVNGGAGWTGGTWTNATPDSAVFSGTAPTSVTINSGGVTVDDLTVSSGTYSFGGTGTLTLSNSTIDIASGLTTTINAALAGSTGLTKSGAGTLVLSGTNKNYTGTTTITGGAIQISGAAAGNLGSTNNGAITLNGGALHANFTANNTVNYAINVGTNGGEIRNLGGDAGRWLMASNTISGSGTLTLSFGTSATRFTLASTTQNSFSGKWIIDSGGSTQRFVDVASSNTFGTGSGDDFMTLRNSGALLLRNGVSLGSATRGVTLGTGGGRINGAGNSTVTLAGKITGASGNTAAFGMENGTILLLSNTANDYAGDTSTVTNSGGTTGMLRLGAAGVIPDGTGKGNVSLGTSTAIDLNGFNETINGLTGAGTVRNDSATAATLTLGGNNQTATFTGTLGAGTGTLHLSKTGTGIQTLSGTVSYTGNTNVSGGTLQLSESANRSYAGQLSGDGALQKSGTGTLTLSHTSGSIGRLRIDGGAVTLTAGLTSHNSGAFTIGDFGTGTLNVAGGSLSVTGTREFVVGLQNTGSVNVSSGSLTLGPDVTVGIGSHAAVIFGVSGDGSLNLSGGTTTIQGTGSIFLARPKADGSSTGNFSGAIDLTGGTLETARTFQESTASTGGTKTSSINLNGGTLKALGNNSNWIDSSIDTLSFGASGATIDTNGFSVTLAKAATGSGGLTKTGSGTLVLAANSTYSGLSSVSGGTLTVNGGITGAVEIGNGATLSGTGTTGDVTVLNGGTLAPGNSPGVLSTGDLILQAGATLGIEIASATPGTGYDQVSLAGSATLAGLLSISTQYTPTAGSLFFILANDGTDAISGTFSNAPLDNTVYTFGSQQYRISYFGDSASLSFTGGNDVVLMAVPEPAAALIGGVGTLLLLGSRRRRHP